MHTKVTLQSYQDNLCFKLLHRNDVGLTLIHSHNHLDTGSLPLLTKVPTPPGS